ncbi:MULTISPECIES: ATP-binding protein [unclassified Rhizobium]|uniref:ATP-binding protein n=1 Tax=unclassified Rhizobium TaxID=2613769 RepID=UPI001ADD2600|nr:MULTISPECIES: YhaN family protein [unclassified Rhizobium]MBO9098088.1 AAA family ATPase [Rhizobium sp. L58/93]MBO9168238.1 AAA family ATPase [Rhizobium sp. L245/93]MBO9184284.1 AAA family ATPase [Rhizobium sp. E27B/91]QXZ84483.1 AAA family ATPase [Rhizobium sp. K1/93]QXZ91377.1 AAA family ATPase [Rhizobium sp. K15/93]
MRFKSLEILRYGALTDRTLKFRPDARLHIIYGPNEAGKSSALAAISDLMFGFPTAAEYSFLHEANTLRVGAEIVSQGGQSLAFRRRRGRKNTLLSADAAETALPEDALAAFIGSLNRDVFERAFGLNSDRLRLGAAAMLKGGGEIGSLLFSAASGLLGLTQLKQSLENEADLIFGPRKSKDRSFYQVLERHDEAKRAERDSELKSGDWKRLLADAADIEAQLAALQAERQETRHTLDRLTMLKTLEPVLAEIDAEQDRLAEFVDLAALPQAFATELAQALARRQAVEAAIRVADAEMGRIADDISATPVDEAIRAAAPAIMARYAETADYRSKTKDMQRVSGEIDEFDARLVQFARRLGLSDVAEVERVQPSDAELARIRRLTSEGMALQRDHSDVGQRLAEARDQLRRLEETAASGRLIDPKPYQEQMTVLQPDLSELSRLDAVAVQVERLERDLEAATARMSPAIDDLERLLSVPLPDIAALAKQGDTLAEAEADSRDAANRLAALENEASEIVAKIAGMQHEGSIVTREEIAEARILRDGVWQSFAAAPKSTKDNAEVVSQAIREADRLADLALANADRVSRHTQLRLRQAELDPQLEAARSESFTKDKALEAARKTYRQLFEPAGVKPLSPDRMIDWRRAVDALSRQRETLDDIRDELAELKRKEARLGPVLADLADATGYSAAASLAPSALARGLSRHIETIAERWTDSRSLEGKRAAARENIASLEQRQSDINVSIAKFEAAFANAALAIGLPEGTTVDMAEAAIEIWKSLPETLTERENRRRRVRGMQRDTTAFEHAVRDLVNAIAPDLKPLAPDAAAEALHERAVSANAGDQRRAALEKARQQAGLRLARCRSDLEEVEAELAALSIQVPGEHDLDALLARLEERRRLQSRLAESRARFALQANGQDEAHVRAGLSGFDRVVAELEIEQLAARDQTQLSRFADLNVRLAENQRQRQLLENGAGAELAVFQKNAAEAEAKALAREWLVLKLASSLLASSMETYRERQADPVMRRAGELFSVLTGGRFSRLVQLYDDRDELQLQAERTGGEKVPLDGLSEGTGDQLYLALRLAFLEDYSARNEPAPLIVDDIFQTFDDDRTASGLKALCGTADRFQTILFTHEMSVVDIATREIGKELDLIRL